MVVPEAATDTTVGVTASLEIDIDHRQRAGFRQPGIRLGHRLGRAVGGADADHRRVVACR